MHRARTIWEVLRRHVAQEGRARSGPRRVYVLDQRRQSSTQVSRIISDSDKCHGDHEAR